jgi:hypothetical protein
VGTNWKQLEEHAQHVYAALLSLEHESITVARDIILTGRDGLRHQFDVYYEFIALGSAIV